MFFFNSFMMISARKLKFVTVKHISSQTAKQLNKSLNKVINLYGRCGFVIRVILKDMEVDKMAELLVNVEDKISEARENEG